MFVFGGIFDNFQARCCLLPSTKISTFRAPRQCSFTFQLRAESFGSGADFLGTKLWENSKFDFAKAAQFLNEVLHFHDFKIFKVQLKRMLFESFWWFYWSSDNMHSRATLEEMLVKEGGELRVHSEPKRYVTCDKLPLETWAHRIQRHSADYFVVDKPAGVPCAPHVSNGRSLAARREATGMPMFSTPELDWLPSILCSGDTLRVSNSFTHPRTFYLERFNTLYILYSFTFSPFGIHLECFRFV